MVSEFLNQAALPVEVAPGDVAGPAINGQAKLTNLAWAMGEVLLGKDLRLDAVHVMNDLEAIARGGVPQA